jgi:MoxR-like ATPase
MSSLSPNSTPAQELAAKIQAMVGRAIVGQERLIQETLVAVLAGGHVLLEGVPGTAKTLLVKALAIALGQEFRRVQMTPDLMPSDVLGTYVFDLNTNEFHLRKGPIFTSFLLADEVNRAPAKTQSAMLEGMQERQVTIDGVTHPLPSDFTVFATQNPIEYEGTYPLPEAQLDRFLVKLIVDYPTATEEEALLQRYHTGFDAQDLAAAGVAAATTTEELAAARRSILALTVSDEIISYIAQLIRTTRESPSLVLGCSPRASVMLLQAAKVLAALRGKDYLSPDEIKAVAPAVLRHRVVLRPEADIEGTRPDDVVRSVLAAVPVPR